MYILSYTPSPNTVDYVKIYIEDEYDIYDILGTNSNADTMSITDNYEGVGEIYYAADLFGTYNNYMFDIISNYKITDPEIIAILCDGLEATAFDEINSYSLYGGYGYHDYSGQWIYATFGSGLIESERYIRIKYDDYLTILNSILCSKDFRSNFDNLPKLDNSTYISCSGITEKQAREIYKVYREELKNISPLEYYSYYSASYSANEIIMYKYIAGNPTKIELPITMATPKALGLYLMYFNENNAEYFYDLYEKILDTSDTVYAESVDLSIYDFAPSSSPKNVGLAITNYDYSQMINVYNFLGTYIKEFQTNMSNEDLKDFDPDEYVLCYASIWAYKDYDAADETYYYEDEMIYGFTPYSYDSFYTPAYLYFLIDKDDYDALDFSSEFETSNKYHFYVAQ